MARQGKKFLSAKNSLEKDKLYSVEEAMALVKKLSFAKFDETVEVSFNLNVDPRHADQQIRGALTLPHGTGKNQKVLVITQGAKEQEAKDAGADVVGGKEIIDEIKKGWFEFDVIVATPDMMGELGKIGKILGPKGLMPNPKTGTVTMDVVTAVSDIKKGKVEYRVDKEGNIHTYIGKVSFSENNLVENFNSIYDVILKARPAVVKGNYMKKVVVSSTMGPGIMINLD